MGRNPWLRSKKPPSTSDKPKSTLWLTPLPLNVPNRKLVCLAAQTSTSCSDISLLEIESALPTNQTGTEIAFLKLTTDAQDKPHKFNADPENVSANVNKRKVQWVQWVHQVSQVDQASQADKVSKVPTVDPVWMVNQVPQVTLVPTEKTVSPPPMLLQMVDKVQLVLQVPKVQTDPLAVQLVLQVLEVFQVQMVPTVTQVKMVSQVLEVPQVNEVLQVNEVTQVHRVPQVTQA